jgi:hypothetical protein
MYVHTPLNNVFREHHIPINTVHPCERVPNQYDEFETLFSHTLLQYTKCKHMYMYMYTERDIPVAILAQSTSAAMADSDHGWAHLAFALSESDAECCTDWPVISEEMLAEMPSPVASPVADAVDVPIAEEPQPCMPPLSVLLNRIGARPVGQPEFLALLDGDADDQDPSTHEAYLFFIVECLGIVYVVSVCVLCACA